MQKCIEDGTWIRITSNKYKGHVCFKIIEKSLTLKNDVYTKRAFTRVNFCLIIEAGKSFNAVTRVHTLRLLIKKIRVFKATWRILTKLKQAYKCLSLLYYILQ